MQPEQLRDLADDLLAEAITVLAADGASPAPDRRYIAHGSVTHDCDLLAVHTVRVVPKVLDTRSERCTVVHTVTYAVTLVRCYPILEDGGKPPSAAVLSEASRDLALDGQALWKGLTRAWVEGNWPEGVPCSQVQWGGLEPLAPLGGFAGWRLTVTIRL